MCNTKKQIIRRLRLRSMFLMIGKDVSKVGDFYDLYTALVEGWPRFFMLFQALDMVSKLHDPWNKKWASEPAA